MNEQKTGFVFYFDAYPILISLPPEQRGWLITALCVYADRRWREEVEQEDILEQFPQLDGQARTAFQFMAAGVQRDTQKWRRTCQLRAQRRQQQGATAGSADGISLQEQERRSLENQAHLKRVVEQLKRAE